jgi:hypothetical protein
LWDKLLVGSSSIPLFTGVAILRQIRGVLLTSEFNDCITLFSESFPEVDIEKCLQSALSMFKVTPESVLRRVYNPDSEQEQEEAIMVDQIFPYSDSPSNGLSNAVINL